MAQVAKSGKYKALGLILSTERIKKKFKKLYSEHKI
jgi:hypothetical protein